MSSQPEPFVSVLTPVYNGAAHLAECIESVISQDYRNWEYYIVDNCSTDRSWDIAKGYCAQDHRIRVVRNTQFVGVIENHNIAFRLISKDSAYCKVVSADDYLYPNCLRRMVQAAESDPQVGIVASYAINSEGVHWIGIAPEKRIVKGAEICRSYFAGDLQPIGAPTSLLYRSDLVRLRDPFFPGTLPNADFAACLIDLECSDLAFVHQILSYERIHPDSLSSRIKQKNAFLIDRIQFLREYGHLYLENSEIERRGKVLIRELYEQLAISAIHLRGRDYWNYQRDRLLQCGNRIDLSRLAGAIAMKCLDLAFNPKSTIEKLVRSSRNAH